MRKSFVWTLIAVNIVGLAVIFGLRQFKAGRENVAETPASYGTIQDFTLIDTKGEAVSLSALKGRPWIANFMFARCAGACPLMSTSLSGLQKELPGNVRFISFSIDPEFDSPQALESYSRQYNAEPGRWLFLTGDKAVLRQILKDVHIDDGALEDPTLHTLRFILVDGAANVRGYYDSSDEKAVQKLTQDAKILARGGL